MGRNINRINSFNSLAYSQDQRSLSNIGRLGRMGIVKTAECCQYSCFLGDILKEMIIMSNTHATLYITSRKGAIKSQVCDLLKEAIKNESDYEHKYAKIKEDMPIEYMEYYIDLDIIRANRGRDKMRLIDITKKIGCSP